MRRVTALRLLALALACVGAGYAGAFRAGGAAPWASWAMVCGVALLMVSLMALGAARGAGTAGVTRGMAVPLAFTFAVLVGCLGAGLALPPGEATGGARLLGLPVRAAIVLYGVGVLPLLVLPFAYARSFDAQVLREDDLARISEVARAHALPGRACAGREALKASGTTASPREGA
ncbi:MAG: hypothetical protein HYX65_08225 [Gemmatimonadetes bacterium]|nr:hypothetical protein [Gemmatimonadota bacterium]